MALFESAKLTAENLHQLLDLMVMNSEKLQGEQLDRLLGLALNLSNDITEWFNSEGKNRE